MIAGKTTRRKPPKKNWGGPRANSGGKRKGAGGKVQPRKLADYADVGDTPADELEAASWAFRGLAVSFGQVMRDAKLTDRERRSEMRAIAGAMNRLLPKARLRRAERAVRGEDEAIARKVDPQLEAVPNAVLERPTASRPHPAPAAPSAELEPVPAGPPKPEPNGRG